MVCATLTIRYTIGTIVTHYRIVSKLGEGGMGAVYEAADLTLAKRNGRSAKRTLFITRDGKTTEFKRRAPF